MFSFKGQLSKQKFLWLCTYKQQAFCLRKLCCCTRARFKFKIVFTRKVSIENILLFCRWSTKHLRILHMCEKAKYTTYLASKKAASGAEINFCCFSRINVLDISPTVSLSNYALGGKIPNFSHLLC